jgi:hypothetical protein
LAELTQAATFADVQRLIRWWNAAAMVAVVVWSEAAAAQLPVCPQPEPDQPVYTACVPGGRFLVVPFLSSFAIDHLIRAEGGPITRDPRALFLSMATADVQAKNPDLGEYVARLAPIQFRRFDTSTGSIAVDIGEHERSFATAIEVKGLRYGFELGLPARIEGGYWRTPAVLEMAFWQGQRATFKVTGPDETKYTGEIECFVVSADGLRLVTPGPATPDLLVRFDPCQ